jgi:hypothetical protein
MMPVAEEGGGMNVRDIVMEWLETHSCDGLCNDEGCGCPIDQLPLCDGDCLDCVPAKRKIATKDDIDEYSDYEVGDVIFVPIE